MTMKTGDNRYEVLFEHYKLLSDGAGQYFNQLYKVLSIYLGFFGTAILVSVTKLLESSGSDILLIYILPAICYVFGLMYYYNIDCLAKIGYNQCDIEFRLSEITPEFKEFVYRNKQAKLGYILSYGTIMAFFIISPLCSMLLGWHLCCLYGTTVLCCSFFLYVLPVLLYFIYIVFSFLIILEIYHWMKETSRFRSIYQNKLV